MFLLQLIASISIKPVYFSTRSIVVYGALHFNRQKTYELVFGAQNRSADEEGMISMTSTKAVAHRGYNENTLKNDIAIIFLPRPVQESGKFKNINLSVIFHELKQKSHKTTEGSYLYCFGVDAGCKKFLNTYHILIDFRLYQDDKIT